MGNLNQAWKWIKRKAGEAKDYAKTIPDKLDPSNPQNNPYATVDQGNFNLPGFKGRDQTTNALAAGAQGRQAFTAADSPWAQEQRNLGDFYKQQMTDDSQSLALRQAQQQQAGNIAQQRSLMASAGPSNSAMMARIGSQNIGRLNQDASGQAGMLRLAERQGMANSLANLSGMGRAQDQNMSQFNAQQRAGNRAANDAYQQGMMDLNLQNSGLQQTGSMNFERNQTNRFNTVAGQPTSTERLGKGIIGGLVAGGKAIFSDERVKTDKADGGGAADKFLSSLMPKTFSYVKDAAAQAEEAKRPKSFMDDVNTQSDRLAASNPGAVSRTGSYTQDIQDAEANKRSQMFLQADERLRQKERMAETPDEKADREFQRGMTEYYMNTRGAGERKPQVSVDVGPATIEQTGPVKVAPMKSRTSLPGELAKGGGDTLGVFAQDVEKTPMGAQAVGSYGGVKTIDTGVIAGPVLASLARLNQRLRKVEGK